MTVRDSRLEHVAQRMRPFEARPSMGVDQILTDLAKGSGLPTQAPAIPYRSLSSTSAESSVTR